MRRFARLFALVDQTTSTNAKVAAMADYFASAPPADAAWAVYFLTGRRLTRLVPHAAVGRWARAATGVDEWLLHECYAVVGDGAETAALVLDQLPSAAATPAGDGAPDEDLAQWIEARLLPLRLLTPDEQDARVLAWVGGLDRWQRLVLFKLVTGELRLGVSQTLVVRALAETAAVPRATIAARLTGDWTPSAEWYERLRRAETTNEDRSRPYPFYLASPIDSGGPGPGVELTDADGRSLWLAEWKWDGIRAQIVTRAGRVLVWSRGDELITDRFPEVAAAATALPDDTVLDGEILAFRDERPLPFAALQRRIGRRAQIARQARDVPVVFMAYDLLEDGGEDIRAMPLTARRERLDARLAAIAGRAAPPPATGHGTTPLLPFETDAPSAGDVLRISPLVPAVSWEALARLRATSRAEGVEGLMLKRRDSPYGVGRKRGDWWKWKIDPFTIDAVLIYAQPGSGKRASLLTDYTFGLWDAGELVPVAKAYSGLSNEEIAELDRWIRRHTVERFGPVRHVEPVQVFELGFEAVAASARHRSGVAVRFPRMLRWRKDKPAHEADTLEALKERVRRTR